MEHERFSSEEEAVATCKNELIKNVEIQQKAEAEFKKEMQFSN